MSILSINADYNIIFSVGPFSIPHIILFSHLWLLIEHWNHVYSTPDGPVVFSGSSISTWISLYDLLPMIFEEYVYVFEDINYLLSSSFFQFAPYTPSSYLFKVLFILHLDGVITLPYIYQGNEYNRYHVMSGNNTILIMPAMLIYFCYNDNYIENSIDNNINNFSFSFSLFYIFPIFW